MGTGKKITREEYMEAAARVRKYIEQEAAEKGKPCWVCVHTAVDSFMIVCTDEVNA